MPAVRWPIVRPKTAPQRPRIITPPTAAVGGDITIIHDAGVLVLSGPAHTIAEAIVASPGIIILGAGEHTPVIGGGDILILHDAGILILTAGVHSIAEALVASPGFLVLSGGVHAIQETLVHTVGTLVLSANAHTLLESISVSPGILILLGGVNEPIGGTSATGAGHTHSIHPHRHRDGDEL